MKCKYTFAYIWFVETVFKKQNNGITRNEIHSFLKENSHKFYTNNVNISVFITSLRKYLLETYNYTLVWIKNKSSIYYIGQEPLLKPPPDNAINYLSRKKINKVTKKHIESGTQSEEYEESEVIVASGYSKPKLFYISTNNVYTQTDPIDTNTMNSVNSVNSFNPIVTQTWPNFCYNVNSNVNSNSNNQCFPIFPYLHL